MTESIPQGRIVSMIEHNGAIYVATETDVYRLINGEWEHLLTIMGKAPTQDEKRL